MILCQSPNCFRYISICKKVQSRELPWSFFFAEGIIELIILNKRIATSPADRSSHSRLDRQREEAAEGRGYERWMNAIDVAVLSAPSNRASTWFGAGKHRGRTQRGDARRGNLSKMRAIVYDSTRLTIYANYNKQCPYAY
jgi:hypothetical protein